jgi:hypothetical protein
MTDFTEIAKSMPSPALRLAARDCLNWASTKRVPEQGRLREMIDSAEEATVGHQVLLQMASDAVTTEVVKRFARVVTTPLYGSMSRLYTDDGSMVDDLVTIEALVTFREEDGIARAMGTGGKVLGELKNAKVVWIRAGSIGITGVETRAPDDVLRDQAWFYVPPGL